MCVQHMKAIGRAEESTLECVLAAVKKNQHPIINELSKRYKLELMMLIALTVASNGHDIIFHGRKRGTIQGIVEGISRRRKSKYVVLMVVEIERVERSPLGNDQLWYGSPE